MENTDMTPKSNKSAKLTKTPARAKRAMKEEVVTPKLEKKMKLELDNLDSYSDSSRVPSPARSMESLNGALEKEKEEQMLENFWLESGVECAAEIASKLASSAVKIAARMQFKKIELERRAAIMSRQGQGSKRVGWPARKLPENVMARGVPASWRFSPGPTRYNMAAVVTTPPRYNKKKLQHHYQDEMFPDVLGVERLPGSQADKLDNIQEELSALHRLDNKARITRVMERKERRLKMLKKKVLRKGEIENLAEEEEEDDTGYKYKWEEYKWTNDNTSSSDEDGNVYHNSTNATMAPVNVNIVACSNAH